MFLVCALTAFGVIGVSYCVGNVQFITVSQFAKHSFTKISIVQSASFGNVIYIVYADTYVFALITSFIIQIREQNQ